VTPLHTAGNGSIVIRVGFGDPAFRVERKALVHRGAVWSKALSPPDAKDCLAKARPSMHQGFSFGTSDRTPHDSKHPNRVARKETGLGSLTARCNSYYPRDWLQAQVRGLRKEHGLPLTRGSTSSRLISWGRGRLCGSRCITTGVQ